MIKLAYALCILFATSVIASAGPGINTIVAFGDSLTDNGKSSLLCAATNFPFPGFAFPPSSYYKGRFTNGLTYIEVITKRRRVHLINEAVSGATTSDAILQSYLGDYSTPGAFILVPGIDTQIKQFVASNQSSVLKSPKTLVTILAGGNDELNNGRFKFNRTGDFYAKSYAANWAMLAEAGVKNILTIIPASLGWFEIMYAKELVSQAETFRKSFPNVRLELFDLSDVIVPIVTDFKTYGFEHGLFEICCENCVYGLPPLGIAKVCANPEKWLIYDGLHPTAEAHRRFALGVNGTGGGIDGFIDKTFGFECGLRK
ncbi:hypothetical protein BC829DRAFT_436011 [Chytridium lagenaria]|nr:hypothetical protein BC829DRAFT_436011 [Chytridium lagenaria]